MRKSWLVVTLLALGSALSACGGDIQVIPRDSDASDTAATTGADTAEADTLEGDTAEGDTIGPADTLPGDTEPAETLVLDTKEPVENTFALKRKLVFRNLKTGDAVSEVKVCHEFGMPNCVLSDGKGEALLSFDAAPGDIIGLLFDRDDYYPLRTDLIIPMNPKPENTFVLGITQSDDLAILLFQAGAPTVPGQGQLLLTVFGATTADGSEVSLLEGAEISLTPSSGKGPLYLNQPSDVPELGLFSTNETTALGVALMLGADPGEAMVMAEAPGYSCDPAPILGLPGWGGALPVRIVEDRMTLAPILCVTP